MSWVNVLKKQDNTKQDKLPITGTEWANILLSEYTTKRFIDDIKRGKKYSNEGIDNVIKELNNWKENMAGDFFTQRPEIKEQYMGSGGERGPTTPTKLKNNAQLLIDNVLPRLETLREGQKSKAGKIFAPYKLTEENLAENLDNFEELDENEQEKQMNFLNRAFVAKWKMDNFKKFLNQNYGKTVRKWLKNKNWLQKKDIIYTSTSNLKQIESKFKKKGDNVVTGGINWELKGYDEPKIKELEEKFVKQGIEYNRVELKPIPIVRVFGIIKELEEKEIGKIKYKVVDNFNAETAQKYLNLQKVKSSLKFLPEKLQKFVKQLGYNTVPHILRNFLDKDYDIYIESGKITDQFLEDMGEQKVLDKTSITNHYANAIHYASTNEKTKSKFYKKEAEKMSLKEIKEQLTVGKMNNWLDEQITRLDRQKNWKDQSISELEKVFIDEILGDETLIKEIEDDNTKKDIQYLQKYPPKFVPKSIGDNVIGKETVYGITVKKKFKFIKQLLRMVQREPELKDIYDELEPEYKSTVFEDILREAGKAVRLEFNREAFTNEFERGIAEITYVNLAQEKSLADAIVGEIPKGTLMSLTDVYNIINKLRKHYKTGQGDALTDKAQEIIPKENMNFTADSPEYETEIKEFAKLFKESIEELRPKIIEDIKETVEDIVKHSQYWEKETLGGKHGLFPPLLKNKIIQVIK